MLGNRLRELRHARGQSLRALAREIAMDPSHLSKIETGTRSCSDEKMVQLAQHFGVAVTELFFQDSVSSEETEATADAVA